MTQIKFIGEKCRIGWLAHLLGFVEPVDLVKEYNRLSVSPWVRLAAASKRMYRPSSKFTEVFGFFKSLAQLADS